jgi:hypothetical protein
MTLWTIVPEELIFADQNQMPPVYEEVDCYGQKVMAERLSPTQLRVVRLLSTNPADYLSNELQPGTIISYRPVIEASTTS